MDLYDANGKGITLRMAAPDLTVINFAAIRPVANRGIWATQLSGWITCAGFVEEQSGIGCASSGFEDEVCKL